MSARDPKALASAAKELRRFSKDASDAVGILVRWSVYIEADPEHALKAMQKVLSESRRPYLVAAAETALRMVDPSLLIAVRKRQDKRAEDRALADIYRARAAELRAEGVSDWQAHETAYAEVWPNSRRARQRQHKKAPVRKTARGNVVAIDFDNRAR